MANNNFSKRSFNLVSKKAAKAVPTAPAAPLDLAAFLRKYDIEGVAREAASKEVEDYLIKNKESLRKFFKVDYDQLADSLDYKIFGENVCIDYDQLAERLDFSNIAGAISLNELSSEFSASDIATEIEVDEIVKGLNYDQLADELDYRKLARQVNLTSLSDEFDYSELARHIDVASAVSDEALTEAVKEASSEFKIDYDVLIDKLVNSTVFVDKLKSTMTGLWNKLPKLF